MVKYGLSSHELAGMRLSSLRDVRKVRRESRDMETAGRRSVRVLSRNGGKISLSLPHEVFFMIYLFTSLHQARGTSMQLKHFPT